MLVEENIHRHISEPWFMMRINGILQIGIEEYGYSPTALLQSMFFGTYAEKFSNRDIVFFAGHTPREILLLLSSDDSIGKLSIEYETYRSRALNLTLVVGELLLMEELDFKEIIEVVDFDELLLRLGEIDCIESNLANEIAETVKRGELNV